MVGLITGPVADADVVDTEVELEVSVESVVAVLLLEDCVEDFEEIVVEVELSFELVPIELLELSFDEVLMIELLELAMLDLRVW